MKCPLVGIRQLLRAFLQFSIPSLFLGFTMALSSEIVLYTGLCLFLKQLIQLIETQKMVILKRAATCRAFSFRWGPSTDALAVRPCFNHAERMVSSSSSGRVFRALGYLENDGPQRE